MKHLKNTMPVCFLANDRLLTYKLGKIYVLEANTFEKIKSRTLIESFKEKHLARIKLAHRLLRLGIRTAIQINDKTVLLFLNNNIHELDLDTLELSSGCSVGPGIRPLYFTNIEGIDGFDDMTVFGGYVGNAQKNKVHIYKRVTKDKWEVIYTFEKGEINHIHNIIADKYNNCAWILTGDFDESAAIWRATDNFNKVERILSNHQIYRGCIGFPTKDGFVYSTDTPFFDNSIRLLKKENNKWVSEKICDIEGSSIYGCQFNDQLVFSTTVEPDGRDTTLIKSMFYQKRGSGIKDNSTHIYMGNLQDGFKNIYSLKKDIFPFIFQFGTIKFPAGHNKSKHLVFTPTATRTKDLQLVKLSFDEKNNS